MELDPALCDILDEVRRAEGRVVALTGAGISAESGIPTFRGEEGYWVVGSRNYMPQEMATAAMFEARPEEVWRWYLYRFGVCRRAEPNAAHRALVALDRALGDRFFLVTQNIDGLHLRAGATRARTACIHGDAAFVRCRDGCFEGTVPQPDLAMRDHRAPLSDAERKALSCPRCGGWLRPHVLFFDECYDEANYRADTAMEAAAAADLLLVVGTSGATNLPSQIGELAYRRGIAFVDVNPEDNPFAWLARRAPRGFALRGGAGAHLPAIAARLGAAAE